MIPPVNGDPDALSKLIGHLHWNKEMGHLTHLFFGVMTHTLLNIVILCINIQIHLQK